MIALLALTVAAATPVGPLTIPPHDYPPELRRAGEHGHVGYRFDVTKHGRITHCAVTASSGFPRLDAATCALVSTGSAPPATSDGHPVAGTGSGGMDWTLKRTLVISRRAPQSP